MCVTSAPIDTNDAIACTQTTPCSNWVAQVSIGNDDSPRRRIYSHYELRFEVTIPAPRLKKPPGSWVALGRTSAFPTPALPVQVQTVSSTAKGKELSQPGLSKLPLHIQFVRSTCIPCREQSSIRVYSNSPNVVKCHSIGCLGIRYTQADAPLEMQASSSTLKFLPVAQSMASCRTPTVTKQAGLSCLGRQRQGHSSFT